MPYEILHFEQHSEQWEKWRYGNIGASDAPVIDEVSPFKTLLQLWEEKIEGKKTPYNEFMERGIALEPEVRSRVNRRECAAYKPVCMHSNNYEWMIASLDGWDEFAENPGIEIKCPGKTDHARAIKGEIPEHYYPQLQHQMIVADIDEWLYVSYNSEFGDKDMISIRVGRNWEYGKRLIEKEQKFYDRMLKFDPPAPCERDLIRVEDPIALELAQKYADLNAKIKEMEAEEKRLRDALITSVNHPRVQVGDLRISRVIRQGNVQYGKIPELQGVNLDMYRGKPIESWRIT